MVEVIASMLDNEGMLLITEEGLESLKSRLLDSRQVDECREEIRRMLEIKEALYWRADVGACCVGNAMAAQFFSEMKLLEAALQALDEDDPHRASSAMREFSLLANNDATL